MLLGTVPGDAALRDGSEEVGEHAEQHEGPAPEAHGEQARERGDWAGLGPGDACGFRAIAGLLVEAARRGLGARRFALRNSGDAAAGSRERVVGYGAWAFEEAAR